MLQVLNEGAVSPDAFGVILVRLNDHLAIGILAEAVPADEQVILEALPVHEQVPLTSSVLNPDLVVAFEFQCVVAIDAVVVTLQCVRVRDPPLVYQLPM